MKTVDQIGAMSKKFQAEIDSLREQKSVLQVGYMPENMEVISNDITANIALLKTAKSALDWCLSSDDEK